MGQHVLELAPGARLAPPGNRRERPERRARRLAAGSIAWHAIELGVAVGAGVAAGSIALIGFGADSLVESLAGLVVYWRWSGGRLRSARAERRAQQLIALGFLVLAAYVGAEALAALAAGDRPAPSWIGIGLAAVTAPAMPLLALAKRRVGAQLGSSATVKEGAQNMLCAYLSLALLGGLLANAVAGWWWADPAAALVIAAVALVEARSSWRGDGCCEAC